MDALPPDTEPLASARRVRLTALIVATSLFMTNLDSTIISTALPAMAKTFHAEPLHMSVALTSYLISVAVFIPASGWIADRFGTRNVFRTAIILFTLGSVACGLAPTLWTLVLARIIQGMGGAILIPVGRLLLLRTVAKSQMVDAMAWLTIPALIGPIMGPPLGGFIVTWFSWRWVFDINVPIGILGVVTVSIFIPNVRDDNPPTRLDLTGLLLTGLAMAALMGGFETIGRGLVPIAWTLAALALGVAACGLYALHARRQVHPVLDFSLLRLPTFMVSLVGGSFFRLAVGAVPFLLPLMLQLGFGDTAMQSGLITFTAAAGALAMKPVAQPLLRRFGFRTAMVYNGGLAAAGIAVCAAFQPSWPPLLLNAVLLVAGFFRSLQFTSYNTIAYSEIPRPRMSAATTLYSTIQQLTLTLGIVVAAACLEALAALRHQHGASIADYHIAFLLVGGVAALGIPISARLAPDAAEDVSGHHTHQASP